MEEWKLRKKILATLDNDSQIVLIEAADQETLAKAFLPYQEYFESPKFAKRKFTFDEFKAWYEKENGSFSYYSDWSGFNIPGYIFFECPCEIQSFEPEATELTTILADVPKNSYIIGAVKDQALVLKHEIAHAMFYLIPEYHREVLCALVDEDLFFVPFFKNFEKGYAASSWIDEVHAYLLTDQDYIAKEMKIPVNTTRMKILTNKLEKLYTEFNPVKEANEG